MPDKKSRKPKKGEANAPKSPRATNLYDVLIVALNHAYNLANTGNIVGLALCGVVVIGGILAWRIPGAQIPEVLKLLLGYTYILVPMGALGISVWGNWFQWKVYNRHITKLTKQRDQLIHGLETGKLVKLTNHTSSGIDVKETHNDL